MSADAEVQPFAHDDMDVLHEVIKQMSAVSDAIGNPPGFRYSSLPALLQAEGMRFDHRIVCPEHLRGLEQECFNVHAHLVQVMQSQGIPAVYCEGYALSSWAHPLIHHAWIIGPNGGVMDCVWAGEGRPKGLAYIGIPFEISYVEKATKATKSASMLETPAEQYPLLQIGATGYRSSIWPQNQIEGAAHG